MSWAEYWWINKKFQEITNGILRKQTPMFYDEKIIDQLWISEENSRLYLNAMLDESKGVFKDLMILPSEPERSAFHFERKGLNEPFKCDITEKLGIYENTAWRCEKNGIKGYIFPSRKLNLTNLKRESFVIGSLEKNCYLCDFNSMTKIKVGFGAAPPLFDGGNIIPVNDVVETFYVSDTYSACVLKNENDEIIGFTKFDKSTTKNRLIDSNSFCGAYFATSFDKAIQKFEIVSDEISIRPYEPRGLECATIEQKFNCIKIEKILIGTRLKLKITYGNPAEKMIEKVFEHTFSQDKPCIWFEVLT